MRVLLCAIGSRGDVQPMLVLASALRERGHHAILAAPPNFRALAEDYRLDFFPVGADTHQILLDNKDLAERSPLLALPQQIALLRRETERQIRDLLEFREPLDLVVGAGLAFGARSLSERQRARYVFVCYTLAGIRDDGHPPAAAPIFGLPRWGNRILWEALIRSFDWALQGPFDRARSAHGLGPEVAPWKRVHAAQTLLAQDALFGLVPPGATAFCHQVPAIVPAVGVGSLPHEVERFLNPVTSGGGKTPLVYVGFGSMPTVDHERILRAVVELSRAENARVLLYSAYPEEIQRELPESVLAVGSLDHNMLFPRVDWIVHHGGAGTTATALRAGVPQLIVPHIVDQFFHGRRLAELGLSPNPVPKARLDARTLIESFRQSRACSGRAHAVARELRQTNGARAAAEYLESRLDQCPTEERYNSQSATT